MVYIVTGEEFVRQTAQNGVCFLEVCLVVKPDLAIDLLMRTPISTQGEEEGGVIEARQRWYPIHG